jgi:hypothetical protein
MGANWPFVFGSETYWCWSSEPLGARTYTRTEQSVTPSASATAGNLAKGLLGPNKHDTLTASTSTIAAAVPVLAASYTAAASDLSPEPRLPNPFILALLRIACRKSLISIIFDIGAHSCQFRCCCLYCFRTWHRCGVACKQRPIPAQLGMKDTVNECSATKYVLCLL